MRIVIATGIFEPESGGPATYTPQLAAQLVEKGHEVTVITYSDTPALETDAKYPFKLVRVVRGNKILNRFKFYAAVKETAAACDLIYTLDWFAAGLPIALAAKVLNKPYIIRVGGDYAWEQKYLESGAAPISLKDFYERGLYLRGMYRPIFYLIRAVLRGAAHVVFNSDAQCALYARYYDLKPDAVSTIWNPVPQLDAARRIVRDAPTKEIVFWGRLIVMKNVEALIRAFAQSTLPFTYTLTIIGDGPQKASLERLIRELHLEGRVQMLPAMPRDEALMRVRNARAFVLPSWTDISPTQVYEALAIRLPMIVTGENYLPIHDQLPLMIDPHSVEQIAAVLNALDDDAQYAALISALSAIHFEHGWDVVVQQHLELFENMTSVRNSFSQQGIRVLQIGADRSRRGILYPDSSAVARQVAYGEHFDVLDIIGFSLAGDKRAEFKASPRVSVYPTNSFSRLFYGIDTIRIARKLPKPDVISVQDPAETGLLGLLIASMMRVPLHVQVHTDILSPAYAQHSLSNRIRIMIAWIVLHRAARIRVVSQRIKTSFEARWQIKAPITVLPIYTDIERIRATHPDIVLVDRFGAFSSRVLVVARLEPEKNVALALLAFAQAAPQDVCLIVVGDGSEHAHLTDLARKLGVAQRVFFEGERDSAPYYHLADLVLVPSLYEGYGIVIVEAMATAKPVVATDVGCAREMGAIIADPQHFAQTLSGWFAVPQDHPRGNNLDKYPYKTFDDYAQKYAADIAACVEEK